MLKIRNIIVDDFFVSMFVLVEGKEDMAYALILDKNDLYHVVDSDIPDDKKAYEAHAKQALKQYENHEYPETITSMWY